MSFRSQLGRVALVGALSLILAACQDTGGAPPGPPLGVASRSADLSKNWETASLPLSTEQAEGLSESVEVSTTALQESAVSTSAMLQEDIRADRQVTSGQPTKNNGVVPLERKVPEPVQPEPEARPDSLLGSRRGDLLALLGPPTLLRREPPAEFWQFSGDGCVLHVYLYETTSSDHYEVTHVELLPRGGLEAVFPRCFGRMLFNGRQEPG